MNVAARQETLTTIPSSLEFPTLLRPQVRISVSDLEASMKFYSALFNRPPIEKSANQATFNPYNPAVDFLLVQKADAIARDGHMGIQLKSSQEIQRYKQRVEKSGFIATLEEAETACCFSVANKAWINDPDGNQWEIFVVTGENTSEVRCGDSCACEAEGCN